MPQIPIGDPYEDEPYPGTTFIPYQPVFIPIIQPQPALPTTQCPSCGLDWGGVMGYVCGRTDCPVQPQVTCTTASWVCDFTSGT